MKTKQEMWMCADELGIQEAVLRLPSSFNLKNTNAGNYIQYFFVYLLR